MDLLLFIHFSPLKLEVNGLIFILWSPYKFQLAYSLESKIDHCPSSLLKRGPYNVNLSFPLPICMPLCILITNIIPQIVVVIIIIIIITAYSQFLHTLLPLSLLFLTSFHSTLPSGITFLTESLLVANSIFISLKVCLFCSDF